jgi:LPXTG-motif cell wall-anchored protein
MAEATAEATAEAMVSASGPSVAWSDTAGMGRIMVGANGMTLYMFDKDEPGKSNCYDDCAVKWPPLLINAGEQPIAADGITAQLGVTERTDGAYQVTANDLPLYYWYKDVNPGDATGQAVGDVWWVLDPAGAPIKTAAAPAAAAPAAATAAETAPAPEQMPTTGGDGGVLGALLAISGVLAGGGWLAFSRKR